MPWWYADPIIAHVQTIVNAINEAIGANGAHVNWYATSHTVRELTVNSPHLVNDMNAGKVGSPVDLRC